MIAIEKFVFKGLLHFLLMKYEPLSLCFTFFMSYGCYSVFLLFFLTGI